MLQAPDYHHLNAAAGWLELGNSGEAKAEWSLISRENQEHPDALDLLWQILAKERQWSESLEVADKLLQRTPGDPAGWINRSFALHELKRTAEAFELLLPAAERFKAVQVIPYNLSCYACQLGQLDQAKQWLDRAIHIAGKEPIQAMAMDDPDLAPLKEYLSSL